MRGLRLLELPPTVMSPPFSLFLNRLRRNLSFAALACCVLSPLVEARPAVIKLATLAPKGTSFHLILQEMGATWRSAPDGSVALNIFTDGTMGGESDMVRRMRLGQLQAGLLTISGITDIESDVSGLQNIPMAFKTLDEAAFVRERLVPKYEKQLFDKGFVVLGWFDSGWVHAFSKKPLRTPDDLRGEKVFVVPGSNSAAEAVRSFNMQPVVLEPTDILVSLQTGLITVVPAPPFYALAGQFFQPAPFMTAINWAPLVGGLVVTRRAFDTLSPAQQELLRKTGAEACAKITVSARREMQESITAMEKRGLKVQPVEGALQEEWLAFAESLQPKIRGPLVPEAAYDEIMGLVKEFRSR